VFFASQVPSPRRLSPIAAAASAIGRSQWVPRNATLVARRRRSVHHSAGHAGRTGHRARPGRPEEALFYLAVDHWHARPEETVSTRQLPVCPGSGVGDAAHRRPRPAAEGMYTGLLRQPFPHRVTRAARLAAHPEGAGPGPRRAAILTLWTHLSGGFRSMADWSRAGRRWPRPSPSARSSS